MSTRTETPRSGWAGALGQRVRGLEFQEYALAIVVVLLFERARLAQAWRNRMGVDSGTIPPAPLP